MKTRIIPTALAGTVLAVIALAGCTPSDTAAKEPKPSAKAAEIVKKDVACEDGIATITDDSAEITVDGDCATIDIAASNTIVNVSGAVESVSISGALNLVTATTVGAVTIPEGSNGNAVVSDNEPAVDDKGEQNEFSRP